MHAVGRALRPPLAAKPKRNNENRKNKMQTTSSETSSHNKQFTPTQFAFKAPTTRQVSLAGDFNNWDTSAAPMEKGPDGYWKLSLSLAPGRYEYRFFADGVWQDDPNAHQRTPNALGTSNCVRLVAARA